jgi:Transglycosylase SLT domain
LDRVCPARRSPLIGAVSIAMAAALAAACAPGEPDGSRPPSHGAEEAPAPEPPAPDAALPRLPGPLAARLTATHGELRRAVERWRLSGGTRDYPPPRAVTSWALHQQRIHLLLTSRPRLGERVLALLPAPAAAHLRATFRARRGLGHITPPTPGRYRTGPPEPADRLLGHFREAQWRFRVPWHVLAAINFVESAFGRMRSSSAAGAQGPMQFIPETWRVYGLGGNVHDPRDAIMGAANYLRASGAPRELRRALYAYNPSSHYVRAVLTYAGRMRGDVRAFLSYYAWQVFVREPDGGTRRITGPPAGG